MAIKWLDRRLTAHGITPSAIDSLTTTPLAAKRVNAFTTLANPLS